MVAPMKFTENMMAMLCLLVIIVGLMTFIFYQRASLDKRDIEVAKLTSETNNLLAKCIIPSELGRDLGRKTE